jgi:hypothetical protein
MSNAQGWAHQLEIEHSQWIEERNFVISIIDKALPFKGGKKRNIVKILSVDWNL